MFLKSLEIRGFKSFADKTELKFKKGVTIVVGPNGSGKSNISDSVRWVLGEQSVKVLRGGKMEDVIFAGTQFRKPVGLAQVSLTLDNSDEELATDYNEVTVSRRIYRSGESEYLINNSKCRLKDVNNLFMDTGIGKEGYSLIGQGKIEAILSGRPEERRALLEEAAGITKFKTRKDEAEKKLNNTNENLIRINDIISTYEERIGPLKEEKEKALKFNELSNELKVKESSIIVKSIKDTEQDLKAINEEIELKNKEIQEKRDSIAQDKEKLKKLDADIEQIEKEELEGKERYYGLKDDIISDEKHTEIQKEKIKSNENLIIKNNAKAEQIKDNAEKNLENQNSAAAEIKKYTEEYEAKNKDISKMSQKNSGENTQLSKMKNELENLRKKEIAFLENKSKLSNKISILEKEEEIKLEKQKEAEERSADLNEKNKNNSEKENSFNENIKDKEKEIAALEKAKNTALERSGLLKKELFEKEKKFKILINEITKSEANKNMLENLEQHYDGYNKSIKNMMEFIKKRNLKDAGSIKVVGEIFKTDKKYETAIETALGGNISNAITDTEDSAKMLIKILKKNHLGRITFLPVDIIQGNVLDIPEEIKNIKGYLGIASEIVETDKKYEKIIQYVLGRTIIAQDMNSGLIIAKRGRYKYKIVTLEGEIINSGGALTGGNFKGKNIAVIGRKREIEEIKVHIQEMTGEKNNLAKEIENINNEINEISKAAELYTKNIYDKKLEKAKQEQELKNIINEIREINEEVKKINFLLSSSEENKKDIVKEIEIKKAEIKKAEEENILRKEEADKLENDILNFTEKAQKNEKIITDLKISLAELKQKINGKKEELEKLKNENLSFNDELKEINQENLNASEENEKMKNEIKSLQAKAEEYKKEIENLDKKFDEYAQLKIKLKLEFKQKDDFIRIIMDEISRDEIAANKKEILKAKKESEQNHNYKKLNEEMQLTYAEALEIAEEVTDEMKIKGEISRIKTAITKLGNVNLSAIEEYDTIKEKYDFMSAQSEDLVKAKNELLKVIDEMTSEMRTVFKENFQILNKNFDETFKDLFKGGRGQLILGEGDELASDIEINVEPPGKKLQNINLMSGGEKVLSAIALLFAILKMKPTPFCILDEIEAALDDANVDRYAEFLKKYAEKTQFIVITHRKGTMEAGDIIYGVTMEERGISKVVSVDLESVVL